MEGSRTSRFSRPPARERVLEVADDLFYAEGLTAVGVDTIAAEADVAKTTLYAHFGSKDGLIASYLENRGETWRQHLAAELERRGSTPEEKLLAVFDVLGDWYRDEDFRGCPFINAAAELANLAHPGYVATKRHRDWLRALFKDLASRAGVKAASALADQLLMLYDAATVTAHLDGNPNAVKAARSAAAALLQAVPRRG
jgi:AcrR family transcriptional regulator